MLELGRVYVNEWMKLIRRKRLWAAFGLCLMVVAMFAFSAYHTHKYEHQGSPESQLQGVQASLTNMELAAQRNPNQAAAMQSMIDSMKAQIGQLSAQVAVDQSLASAEWMHVVQRQIDTLQQQAAKPGPFGEPPGGSAYFHSQVMSLQYAVSHHVRPLPSWQVSGFTAMEGFLDLATTLFLPLVIVFVVADLVSGEATSGTIKLLLVRPMSRTKILLGKWLVAITSALLLTFALCTALLLTAFAIFGVAGGIQPKVVGVTYTRRAAVNQFGMFQTNVVPHYTHAITLPQWRYLLIGVLLISVSMMVVATLALFLSELIPSSMVSTALAIGLVIGGVILTAVMHGQSWFLWFYALYLNPMDLWTGQFQQTTQSSVTLWIGMAILGVWGFLALAVSLVHFRRKDVLQA